MEYRGVKFSIVQTIDNGWRWAVKRDHNDKVGISPRRDAAIVRAQRFIDELIKIRGRGREEERLQ
jgi:hypothetical protein